MPRLWVLRHGQTAWSATKRLQGRRDIGLDEVGLQQAVNWQLPEETKSNEWFTSPLQRCRQTVKCLRIENATIEPRLIEMDWGEWEGHTRSELRKTVPDRLVREEAKGLDLQPPSGESPRTVQARLRPWLDERSKAPADTGAVTHRGVIRALYALATGWDMCGMPPDNLNWNAIHCFNLSAAGNVSVSQLNVPLAMQ